MLRANLERMATDKKDHAVVQQDNTASLQAEIETLKANLEHMAMEKEQELEEAMFESRENIDSLRELLSEGEQERVELENKIQRLNQELGLARSQGGDEQKAMYLSKIEALEAQLVHVQQEAQGWKERAEITMDHERNTVDINAGADSSLQAMKLRLAKAEAAVEAERQAYQVLEQKSKQWQGALEENIALRNQMMEFREREKAFEQMNHPGSSSFEMQQALSRAQAAEQEAHSLHVELERANNTITNLSGEVNDLITRLKEQSKVIVEMKQKEATFESVPINEIASNVPFMEEPPAMPETLYGVDQNAMASPQPNETSLFDLYQQPPPPSQEHIHTSTEASNPQEMPPPNLEWSVPGGIIESEETANGPQRQETTPPKKVGFWSWVAGADLASS